MGIKDFLNSSVPAAEDAKRRQRLRSGESVKDALTKSVPAAEDAARRSRIWKGSVPASEDAARRARIWGKKPAAPAPKPTTRPAGPPKPTGSGKLDVGQKPKPIPAPPKAAAKPAPAPKAPARKLRSGPDIAAKMLGGKGGLREDNAVMVKLREREAAAKAAKGKK